MPAPGGPNPNSQLWTSAPLPRASSVRVVRHSKSSPVFTFGFAFALWSATSGVHGLMHQPNIAYEVKESRSFLRPSHGLAPDGWLLRAGARLARVDHLRGILQSYIGDHLGWSGALLTVSAVLR